MAYMNKTRNMNDTNQKIEFRSSFVAMSEYNKAKNTATHNQKDDLISKFVVKSMHENLSEDDVSGIVCVWSKGIISNVTRAESEMSVCQMQPELLSDQIRLKKGTIKLLSESQNKFINALVNCEGFKTLYVFLENHKIECWMVVEKNNYVLSKSCTKLCIEYEDQSHGESFNVIVLEEDQLLVNEMPEPQIILDVKK